MSRRSLAVVICLCWSALFLSLAPSAATAFSYQLYNDSACTQPLPYAYNNTALTYQTSITCYNLSLPDLPMAQSVSYYCTPITQRGVPNINFHFSVFANSSCPYSVSLQAVWNTGSQNTGQPQNSCVPLGLFVPGLYSPFLAVWGTVSCGGAPFPNAAHKTVSWIMWPSLAAMAALATMTL